ncbi:MAG: sigma-70 family RNA polymerase sigma factor [Deltaproteobacteria bacterium]|nr:sigma-70 family RNA polymerase sigma factor [Deltaproteobacteria bacterium]
MALLGSAAALEAYRHSLAGIVPLDPEEERSLAQRWKTGDEDAGRRLVEASLPFVITIATEYRRWGVPLEDLIQQGNLGLLKGALRFDPERDCRLITYAVYWIRAEIREYVVRGYRLVRIGGSKGERRALRAYRRTREEDPARLAELSGVSVEHATRLLPMLRQRDASLDATPDGETSPVERLRDPSPSPEELCQRSADGGAARERIHAAMAQLSSRERWIVERRVLDDEDVTLESLGQRLGISKERVRQIEARAFQKLRGALTDLAA